jgi:hypothetical protein
MFNQAPINRIKDINWNYSANAGIEPVKPESHAVRQLLADVSELVELQARLTANDIRASITGMIAPMMLLAIAAIVLLGMIPVIFLAIANVLVILLDWPSYAAQFASGGLAFLAAFIMSLVAITKLKQVASPMQQSVNELSKNLETMRELLRGKVQPDREYPNYPR